MPHFTSQILLVTKICENKQAQSYCGMETLLSWGTQDKSGWGINDQPHTPSLHFFTLESCTGFTQLWHMAYELQPLQEVVR